MEEYKKVYPDLPEKSGNPDLPDNSDNFPLQKSFEALEKLEKEAVHYHNVRKKYKRYYSILSKISVSTGTISFILSSSAISASLTGVGIAIGAFIGGVG